MLLVDNVTAKSAIRENLSKYKVKAEEKYDVIL